MKKLLLASVLVIVLFLSPVDSTTLGIAQPGEVSLTARDIVIKDKQSMVYLEMVDYTGRIYRQASGVLIEGDLIVTNAHAVADAYAVRATFPDGKICIITEFSDLHLTYDIALLCLPEGFWGYGTPIAIGDPWEVMEGDVCYAYGSPRGLEYTISEGIISGLFRPVDGFDFALTQHTAPISVGSSGGALINDKGELIGITTAMEIDGQNLNFAVPIAVLDQLILDCAVPMPFDHATWRPELPEGISTY